MQMHTANSNHAVTFVLTCAYEKLLYHKVNSDLTQKMPSNSIPMAVTVICCISVIEQTNVRNDHTLYTYVGDTYK